MEKQKPRHKSQEPVLGPKDIKKIKKNIEDFKLRSRWLPNTSLQTYFGKPPFENYGNANTKPVDGGTFYGGFMKSHNLNPHRGGNHPQYKQVQPHAQLYSQIYPTKEAILPRALTEMASDVTKSVFLRWWANELLYSID